MIRSSRGSILIASLWMLVFFSIVASSLAARARAELHAIGRFTHAMSPKMDALSGLSYASDFMRRREEAKKTNPDKPAAPAESHKNSIRLPGGASVTVEGSDEEAKVNLNSAQPPIMGALYISAGAGPDQAKTLVDSTFKWKARKEDFREFGERLPSQGAGFGSVEELLLVPGMTRPIWEKLRWSLTVYGSGRVNLNTVPKETLLLLGVGDSLVERIAAFRDRFFKQNPEPGEKPFENLGDLTQKIGVSSEENAELSNLGGLWSFESRTTRFLSTAADPSGKKYRLEFILDEKGRILYLKEL